VASDASGRTTGDAPTRAPLLKWPPPGLERTQGDLLVIASRAALAGGFMVLPLLFVAALEQDFATFGPFADAWWVLVLLTSIGLAFGLDAITRVSRSLRRAGRALENGYGAPTVLRVLADGSRDMGFLLSGARHFSVLDDREREAIAAIRVAEAILFAAAGLWLTVSVSIGLFLAARGVLTPAALQMLTLAPAAIGYAFGAVAAMVQEGMVRRARRVWYKQPWADDLASDEISDWKTAAPPGLLSASDGVRSARLLRGAGALVAGLGLVVILPVLTLAPASAVAPILTAISAPSVEKYRPRTARIEAFRSFAIDGDVSIAPSEAGVLLNDLMYVAAERDPSPGEQGPSRVIERPWIPEVDDVANPLGLEPFVWSDSLIGRAAAGLSAEQRNYLASLTDHPATADFSRLARATALDVGGARWDLPFPMNTTMATVPLPRFGSLRSAANVHVASAAYALVEGRPEEAERFLSELIAVGFLLADDGPTLIDNLIGVTLAEAGGEAMTELLRVTGQTERAAAMSRLNQVAERASAKVTGRVASSPEAFVRSLPDLVLDPATGRGLRWEYFINLATIAPCLNMHRMVFGSGDAYDRFVEEAHASLVRYPSDEALFDLARHGWVGATDPGPPGLFGRIASLYMNDDDNSCIDMLQNGRLAGSF
jgi:hypothetical protein